MKRYILLGLFTGSLLAQSTTGANEARIIGGGKGWTNGGRPVLSTPCAAAPQSACVPRLATLTGTSSDPLVLECGASGWLYYSCSHEKCQVPVCSERVDYVVVHRVDPTAWAPQPKASAIDMLASFFRREPKPLQTLGVRAAGNLTDAVVRQTGNRVFWAPALTRLLEGSYCFRLGPLPVGGSAKPRTFSLEWTRDNDGAVDLPNLAPGAYTLMRGEPEGGSCQIDDPDAAPVWVVVAPDASFARLGPEWESYSMGLAQLAENTSPEAAAAVRHVVIAWLADSIGK
jgi:hypothetical protein